MHQKHCLPIYPVEDFKKWLQLFAGGRSTRKTNPFTFKKKLSEWMYSLKCQSKKQSAALHRYRLLSGYLDQMAVQQLMEIRLF